MRPDKLFLLLAASAAAWLIPMESQAEDGPPANAPIVLNGQLQTGDFDGGVGRNATAGADLYSNGATLIYVPRAGGGFSATTAFVAAARGQALRGASMNGRSAGHH